jgi:hypothetical protein
MTQIASFFFAQTKIYLSYPVIEFGNIDFFMNRLIGVFDEVSNHA